MRASHGPSVRTAPLWHPPLMVARTPLLIALLLCAACSFNNGGFASEPGPGRREGGASDGAVDGAGDVRPGPAADGGAGKDVPAPADVPVGGPDVGPGPADTLPPAPDLPVVVDMAPAGCAAGTKSCAGMCIPTAACCLDSECTGGFACIAAACSTTACRTGFKRCGAGCIAMASCCPAEGCCSHADCGACQKCSAGACVNQTASEDLKSECPTAACRPGSCNGNGVCTFSPDGGNGPACMGECVRCQGGACRPFAGTCGMGQMCEDGKCPPRPPVAVRININGQRVGPFAADPGLGGICGGAPYSTSLAINGSNDDLLYQSEMFGAPLTCSVGSGALPTGPYQVVLHFAEIYWGPGCPGAGPGTGARVFDIELQGQKVASNVDLFAEGGCAAALDGSGHPVTKRFDVMITDGTLHLNFPASANNAKLSALELLSTW
jgi:hypothetical protein